MSQVLQVFKNTFSKQTINPKDLIVKHCRASGKGGQNVNKVNSKVEVRLKYKQVSWLPREVSELLDSSLYATSNNELVIKSDRFRSQDQNMKDCLEKIYNLIDSAVVVPGETSQATKNRVSEHIQREKSRMMISKQYQKSKKDARRARD